MFVWKCLFFSWSFEAFSKKYTEFKHRLQFAPTLAITSYFPGDITHLNQLGLHLFGYVARSSASQWSSERFAGGN